MHQISCCFLLHSYWFQRNAWITCWGFFVVISYKMIEWFSQNLDWLYIYNHTLFSFHLTSSTPSIFSNSVCETALTWTTLFLTFSLSLASFTSNQCSQTCINKRAENYTDLMRFTAFIKFKVMNTRMKIVKQTQIPIPTSNSQL